MSQFRGLIVPALTLTAALAAPALTTALVAGPALTPLTLKEKGATFRIYVYKRGLAKGLAHDHVIALPKFKGQLKLDEAKLQASSVSFQIKAADLVVIDTGLSKDDKAKVKKIMDSDEVLDVAKHKTITFESKRVRVIRKRKDPKRGLVTVLRVTGMLMLHGVTKSVDLDVELHKAKGLWIAIGGVELKQSDFGIEPYSAFLGTIGVKDKIKVRFLLPTAP